MQNRIFEPLPGTVGSKVDLEHRWKSAQERSAEVGIACHVSTHEAGDVSAAAGMKGAEVTRLDLGADAVIRERPGSSFAAAHMMSVSAGKHDDISRVQFQRLPIGELY